MTPFIDADVPISPTPQGGNSISIDELLRRMDRAGVDRAVTWLQPPYVRSEVDAGNAYVAKAMRAYPDRILGFGWADPNLGLERASEDVRRAVAEYGFFGVKLNGAQNGYPIDDPVLAMPVIARIAAAGSVLALHVGADAPISPIPPAWRRLPGRSRPCALWSCTWAVLPSTTSARPPSPSPATTPT